MQIVWGGTNNPEINAGIGEFVSRMVFGRERGIGKFVSMGVIRKGELIAGVLYHNWSSESEAIEITAAASDPRWLTKKTLRAVFEYPFQQIGCQAVVARIAESNKRARRIWRAVGSEEYIIPRLRGRHEAEVVMILTDEAWRKFGIDDVAKT
jgi:RimJ/RimL family protein N-acetyltransferase